MPDGSAVPVVIYDTATPEFKENRVFDHQYAAKFPGASMWAMLGERVRQRGWSIMTADVFLGAPSARAVCVSDMVTPYTRVLLEQGVIPAVILSGESPNIAWGFYHWLRRYSQPFHHAFLFRGAVTRPTGSVQVHPFYWPNSQREIISNPAWRNREYLVAVASNKDRFSVAPDTPFLSLCRFAKRLVWNGLWLVDPLFRFDDLYQRRLDAVCYFADVPGCRVYGTGWDKPSGWSRYPQTSAGAVPYDKKLKVMSNYQFVLCFENCVFPGYVTEKVFDCFFAGCIPVYWGAPDIKEYVPAETIVDARQFETWTDLDHYLRGMSALESERYRAAAQNFLAGKEFNKFHQDSLVDELISIVESEFGNIGIRC